jgi:hypothetical protein
MSGYANNEDYKRGADPRKEMLFPLQTKGDEYREKGKMLPTLLISSAIPHCCTFLKNVW